MGVEFRVLGTLEVLVNGTVVPLPSGRARVLLATLLLRSNQVVSVDELVDRLWDGAPPNPARAKATLQMVVTRLNQGRCRVLPSPIARKRWTEAFTVLSDLGLAQADQVRAKLDALPASGKSV